MKKGRRCILVEVLIMAVDSLRECFGVQGFEKRVWVLVMRELGTIILTPHPQPGSLHSLRG